MYHGVDALNKESSVRTRLHSGAGVRFAGAMNESFCAYIVAM